MTIDVVFAHGIQLRLQFDCFCFGWLGEMIWWLYKFLRNRFHGNRKQTIFPEKGANKLGTPQIFLISRCTSVVSP